MKKNVMRPLNEAEIQIMVGGSGIAISEVGDIIMPSSAKRSSVKFTAPVIK